ncbi:glycerol-3-phosphate dehydrogenase/oxidase [Lutimonas saemankumensis]|uniref:glycerol-3-phosphate dehydrogenase/oxidase n=1 Tax=Lutimonas saemankumensis TaxID=483016 RepID=UPI001CD375DA|nr:glycerol-3-phosphate dehydrogenase/oxidase [Lutimonas saemankumensis]MCA0932672.1 glycerol-3-phosphate dehydrogenase/oxidase [Lutimonas saemankumensis]
MPAFSNKYRLEFHEKLKNESFDLLVIGGGITGAGIALDAVSRGLKVALVEQNDFSSGTSSKSTKLIHGGLRYLKQFDLFLVHEVGSERAILHNLAPHLVVPDKMILPIIENGTYGSFLTSIGLKIYDLLANVEGDDKRKMLDKETTLKLEPLLPDQILEGAGYYAEYRTDDARLTIEVLKTAVREGAIAINYAEVKSLIYHHDHVKGALVYDKFLKKEYQLNASYVVNATGPWVDDLRESMDPQANPSKRLQLTKGVHLVFPHEKLPVKQSIYFDVPDGRMIFAIPRHGVTYVGTTDTKFEKEPEAVDVKNEDAIYLVEAVNNMFPEIELTLEDVISSWAGLRPLIWKEGKSASELSRKDEIFESDSGLISIAGGKLTGYRKMAERVVDVVSKRAQNDYNVNLRSVQTENLKLTENSFTDYQEVKAYVKEIFPLWKKYNVSKKSVKSLVHRYGKQTELIFHRFKGSDEKNTLIRLGIAELQYCMDHEMIVKPLDFLERRSGKLYFDPIDLNLLVVPVLNLFSETFNWDENTCQKEKEILEKAIQKSKIFT